MAFSLKEVFLLLTHISKSNHCVAGRWAAVLWLADYK